MFDLLDSILAQHDSPTIISEQHDTSKIDWQAAMMDTAEMVKGGANVVQAAIGRAALDTSTGRVAVMVAGRAPWHKLGVNVASAVSSADAMRLASLNWQVLKTPMTYTDATGTVRSQNMTYALIRDDTGAILGTVGSRYQPIQNAQGFSFLDEVLSDFGARYETAGAIHGGKRVWMQVALPKSCFAVAPGDDVQTYAIMTLPHDGSGCAYCYPTTERVVCGNTFRIAEKGRSSGVGIRHTGSIRGKIQAAQSALGIAVQGFERFAGAAEAMTAAQLPSIRHYADDVLDAVLDVTAAQAKAGADVLAAALDMTAAQRELERKSIAQKIERRGEILADILDRYEGERNGINGMRGTVWSGFNAITEHADYNRLGRKVGSSDAQLNRRFESVLDGPADAMKQAAYAKAMQLV